MPKNDTVYQVPTAAEPEPAAPAEPVERTLQDDVEDALNSKLLRVRGSIGKAQFIMLPKDIDYTAGGILHPRFIHNNPKDIQRRRDEGYLFPEEISKRLPNITRGSLVLMVCHKDSHDRKKAELRRRTQQWNAGLVSSVKGDPHLTDLKVQS